LTPDNVIVNDVYVDPKDSAHVLLATDHAGVLRSEDFAASFHQSNAGFSARQVVALAADPIHPAVVYAGVVNDKEEGGVFQSVDGGAHWRQDSVGLDGRDVYSLASTPAGTLLAGTTHGIFRLQGELWVNTGQWLKNVSHEKRQAAEPVAPSRDDRGSVHQPMIDSIVYSLVSDGNFATYAGTSDGLVRSENDGIAWTPISTLRMGEVRFFAEEKGVMLAAGLKRMSLSTNGGTRWVPLALPAALTQISAVAVDGDRSLWVGGREGVFYSPDNGASWRPIHNLEIPQVDAIYFDRPSNRILLTTANSTMVFAVQLPDHTVRYWETGWRLRFARPMGTHLLAATLYDGVVIQPKMVDSEFGKQFSGTTTKASGAAAGSQ
jgi:ligand-binding sensor domain-containing protein